MSLATYKFTQIFFLEKFKEKEIKKNKKIFSKKEIYVCVYACNIASVDFV